MKTIKQLKITNFRTESGLLLDIALNYEIFGQEINQAPMVLVNHALTGNSNVCGPNGWWNDLIGPGKCIDTNHYCVIAFNVPGNGYGIQDFDSEQMYKSFVAKDIASLFANGLKALKITNLFAIIGGSVGGGIAWELAALKPNLAEHLIPIATDWKSTDWIISNCHIQELILNHSSNPIEDARIHAMTLYRTPESLKSKFNRTETKEASGLFNVESWLNHHGRKLEDRFKLSSYKLMNQILRTIDITRNRHSFLEVASKISSTIHMVTINSDLFFKPEENWTTYVDLKSVKPNVHIHEIKSIHGHDAFLIEFGQLQSFLNPVFSKLKAIGKPTKNMSKCA